MTLPLPPMHRLIFASVVLIKVGRLSRSAGNCDCDTAILSLGLDARACRIITRTSPACLPASQPPPSCMPALADVALVMAVLQEVLKAMGALFFFFNPFFHRPARFAYLISSPIMAVRSRRRSTTTASSSL